MRLLFIALFFIPVASFSQIFSTDVISSNGEFSEASNGSLSWTLGEVGIESYANSSHLLTEGFHQCMECGPVAINDLSNELNVAAYPNPFHSTVVVDIPNNQGLLEVVLINAVGQIVFQAVYSGNGPTTYDLGNLAAGMYVMQLKNNEGIIQTKKVQKL